MVLQIFREAVRAGCEEEYARIEERRAQASAELRCPHPHAALVTVDRPLEVWWLNAFESDADRERVEAAYAANRALMDALERDSPQKAALTTSVVNTYARFRAQVSGASAIPPMGGRFWAVAVMREELTLAGAVFEDSSGMRFVFAPASTRRGAEDQAAAIGNEAHVLAVRPEWGMPAESWVLADPEFWAVSPSARRR